MQTLAAVNKPSDTILLSEKHNTDVIAAGDTAISRVGVLALSLLASTGGTRLLQAIFLMEPDQPLPIRMALMALYRPIMPEWQISHSAMVM